MAAATVVRDLQSRPATMEERQKAHDESVKLAERITNHVEYTQAKNALRNLTLAASREQRAAERKRRADTAKARAEEKRRRRAAKRAPQPERYIGVDFANGDSHAVLAERRPDGTFVILDEGRIEAGELPAHWKDATVVKELRDG